MPATVESMTKDALELPVSGRALLAEKLLDSLSGVVDAKIEQIHLRAVEQRRAAGAAGKTGFVDGDEAMKQICIGLQKCGDASLMA